MQEAVIVVFCATMIVGFKKNIIMEEIQSVEMLTFFSFSCAAVLAESARCRRNCGGLHTRP